MKYNIAYCGLDCTKCDAYIATLSNDNVLRKKTAKLWSEMNNAPITAEMINCMGCRENGIKTPYCESMCQIRQCALQKKINTCAECSLIEMCETVKPVLANSAEAQENIKMLKQKSEQLFQ